MIESESRAGMSGRGIGPSEVDICSIQLPEVVEARSPSKKEPEPGSECTSETELIPDVDGERGWLSDGWSVREREARETDCSSFVRASTSMSSSTCEARVGMRAMTVKQTSS